MLSSKALQHLLLHKASPALVAKPAFNYPIMLCGAYPQRTYMLQWLPKYRDIYKPKWFDNPDRRWDRALKSKKYMHRGQDPLFFDHKQFKINGGI